MFNLRADMHLLLSHLVILQINSLITLLLFELERPNSAGNTCGRRAYYQGSATSPLLVGRAPPFPSFGDSIMWTLFVVKQGWKMEDPKKPTPWQCTAYLCLQRQCSAERSWGEQVRGTLFSIYSVDLLQDILNCVYCITSPKSAIKDIILCQVFCCMFMCVSCFFSCQYLPSDWLERLF